MSNLFVKHGYSLINVPLESETIVSNKIFGGQGMGGQIILVTLEAGMHPSR
jgi:hypothetical protein